MAYNTSEAIKDKVRMLNQLVTESENPTVCEDIEAELQEAWDDVSGRELEPEKARKARKEEIEYIRKTNLYTKVDRKKATSLGKKVVAVRWIDINKGDDISRDYRSRLVAQEIKMDKREDLFAATPPLAVIAPSIAAAPVTSRVPI